MVYNLLKLDNNVRGKIGEEIALNHIKSGIRCKCSSIHRVEEYPLCDEQKEFLIKYWKYLDIIT